MVAVDFSETVILVYQITPRNVPKDSNTDTSCCVAGTYVHILCSLLHF